MTHVLGTYYPVYYPGPDLTTVHQVYIPLPRELGMLWFRWNGGPRVRSGSR